MDKHAVKLFIVLHLARACSYIKTHYHTNFIATTSYKCRHFESAKWYNIVQRDCHYTYSGQYLKSPNFKSATYTSYKFLPVFALEHAATENEDASLLHICDVLHSAATDIRSS